MEVVRQRVWESDSGRRARYLQVRVRGRTTILSMKVLHLLHVVVAQAFYRWAMAEISPMHPDVPKIMLRQQQLAEKYRRIWA